MPEFLVRSGDLCVVSDAPDVDTAVAGAITDYVGRGGLTLGMVIEVIPLNHEKCEEVTVWSLTEDTLKRLGFTEDTVCGSDATITTPSSMN